MGHIKRKIEGLKEKIKNFDLASNEDNEEKFIQEDLNYYKEKQILLEAEIDLINKKYEKNFIAKQNEQKETEQKLVQKSEKLNNVAEETEIYIAKIKEIENELVKMNQELVADKGDKEDKQEKEDGQNENEKKSQAQEKKNLSQKNVKP